MPNTATDLEKTTKIQTQIHERVKQEKQAYCNPGNPRNFTSQEIMTALDQNEDGDACLMIKLFRESLCFDHSEKSFFRFNGNFWEEDRVNQALREIDRVVTLYAREVQNQAQTRTTAAQNQNNPQEQAARKREAQLLDRIRSLQTLQRKNQILKLAVAGKNSLGITGLEWDKNPWLLACANGVIDLRSGHFWEGRPEDYVRTAAPTIWQGFDETAPRWERFLEEIFDGSQEMVAFMQRLLGYSLIGKVSEHNFPILWGIGRNGKGTLLEVLKFVLGPLVGPLPAETVLQQKAARSGAAPSPDLMTLRGRRIAWASETGEGRKLNTEKVKWLVGGDTLTARVPYGRHQIEFSPSHTLFLLTNHKPQVDADDYAAWDRIFLIPFSLSFVDETKARHERQRDAHLFDRLIDEASGILAWLVRGCLLWQAQELNPPEAVKIATKEYRKEEDVLGHFLQDCCVIMNNSKVRAQALYTNYQEWCGQNGYKPETQTSFGRKMGKRFQKDSDYKGNFYTGVGLREE